MTTEMPFILASSPAERGYIPNVSSPYLSASSYQSTSSYRTFERTLESGSICIEDVITVQEQPRPKVILINRNSQQSGYFDEIQPLAAKPPAIPHEKPVSNESPTLPAPATSPTGPSPRSSSLLWPRLLLLGVAAVWATNFPAIKALQSGPKPVVPAVAALIRFVLATAALVPFAVLEVRRVGGLPDSFLRPGFGIGFFTFLGYFFQSLSLKETNAGKTAFLCSFSVILIPVLQRVQTRTRHAGDYQLDSFRRAWTSFTIVAAPIVAISGMALLEFGGSGCAPNIGDVWGVLQAFGFALSYIITEQVATEFESLSLTTTTLNMACVAFFSGMWALIDASVTTKSIALPDISGPLTSSTAIAGLAYTGIISTALTVWLMTVALERVSAAEMAVLLSTEPVWAAFMSSLVLGETMSAAGIAGAVLIMLACIVCQLRHVPSDWIRSTFSLYQTKKPTT